MRNLRAILAVAVLVAAGSAQAAERRMFIISSNADGYGVDRCLANGEKCGAAAATAYCHAQQYASATSYKKVDRDDITGSIPAGNASACVGSNCDQYVAIVCSR